MADELLDIPLHAWGLSLRTLRTPIVLPRQVISCDSSSWNWRYGRDVEDCRASGLSVRQWAITVALPRYQAAVEYGRSSPKQFALPWQPERLIDHPRKSRPHTTWLRHYLDGANFLAIFQQGLIYHRLYAIMASNQ